jgi:Na+-transporting NADH:ubiquinone oxidoreductase subunit NqrC
MLSRGKQFISTLILIVGFALAPSAALSGPDAGQLGCKTVQQYLDKQVQILLDDNVLSMYLLKETFIDMEIVLRLVGL